MSPGFNHHRNKLLLGLEHPISISLTLLLRGAAAKLPLLLAAIAKAW
jgi:hypothetical protein